MFTVREPRQVRESNLCGNFTTTVYSRAWQKNIYRFLKHPLVWHASFLCSMFWFMLLFCNTEEFYFVCTSLFFIIFHNHFNIAEKDFKISSDMNAAWSLWNKSLCISFNDNLLRPLLRIKNIAVLKKNVSKLVSYSRKNLAN